MFMARDDNQPRDTLVLVRKVAKRALSGQPLATLSVAILCTPGITLLVVTSSGPAVAFSPVDGQTGTLHILCAPALSRPAVCPSASVQTVVPPFPFSADSSAKKGSGSGSSGSSGLQTVALEGLACVSQQLHGQSVFFLDIITHAK